MDSQIKFDLIKIIVKLKGHKNSIKVYIRSKVVSSHEIVRFEQKEQLNNSREGVSLKNNVFTKIFKLHILLQLKLNHSYFPYDCLVMMKSLKFMKNFFQR